MYTPISDSHDQYEFHIDALGQSAGMWNLYTQLTFCYALPGTSRPSNSSIVNTLTQGLQRLSSSFPWIAGQVVREPRGSNPEYYVVKPFEPTPTFVVKDLSTELPSLETYRRSGYGVGLLDENVVAPRNTKPVADEVDPKPVFLVQVTFITDGLFLTFAAQHGTLDIVGQAEVIRLLSKACHGEPFTQDKIDLGNRDRRTVIPLLDERDEKPIQENRSSVTDRDSSQKPVKTATIQDKRDNKDSTPAETTWTDFIFTANSLHALKAAASETKPPTTPFISTDDALSAFIWQRITLARSPRLTSTSTSTFARTVDLRRYLDIPPTYPGNLATKTYSTLPLPSLLTSPLGTIASQLRSTIDPDTSNLAYEARATATSLLHTSSTPKPTPSGPSRDLSRDLAFSSWSKVDYCHDLDFNLGLGKPEAVRRPMFSPPNAPPMEGLVYLLPRTREGDIGVMVCLRREDLGRLKQDEVWKGYAQAPG